MNIKTACEGLEGPKGAVYVARGWERVCRGNKQKEGWGEIPRGLS